MFNLFLVCFILLVLKVVGAQLARRHQRSRFTLSFNTMSAKMDMLKVKIGKRLLPVIETCWREVAVLTGFDL